MSVEVRVWSDYAGFNGAVDVPTEEEFEELKARVDRIEEHLRTVAASIQSITNAVTRLRNGFESGDV